VFGNLRHKRHVLERSETGYQIVELEYEAHVLASKAREGDITGGREIVIEVAYFTTRRHIQASEYVQQSGFSAPGWAEYHDKFPRIQVQIHAAERVHFDVADTVHFRDVVDLKNRNWKNATGLKYLGLSRWHSRAPLSPT
jgi:hypothetical protein